MSSSEIIPQEIKAVVVDDEEDTLDSICQTLEIGGITVVGKGYDGEQAYELYKTLTPVSGLASVI